MLLGTYRKLEWSKQCYLQASLQCSQSTLVQLTASWNASANLVASQCIEYEKPKCDTTTARSCVLELWRVVDEAHDFNTACRYQILAFIARIWHLVKKTYIADLCVTYITKYY
jgi:hypothetical protein